MDVSEKTPENKQENMQWSRQTSVNGARLYGYMYLLDDNGGRVGLELNHEVILVDEDGTKWTEVHVVVFIFKSAAEGIAIRKIARMLNDKGIPPPAVAKGQKRRKM